MPGTAARHRALRDIITDTVVSSQGDLVGSLAGRGFVVTQATISRDLQSMGAIKARDSHGTLRYVLSNGHNPGAETHATLGRALAEYAETINVSGNLVVITTPAGAAHVVALAIDAVDLPGTIGTIAGDDTLLIIADEATTGRAVAEDLERIGGKA